MNLKTLIITFIIVYALLSLPAILGIGYVIDWVPEATLFQKFKGYVMDGLLNDFFMKAIIACIVGMVLSLGHAMR
ncbi:hypothetical protein [Caldalkalibacillus salinus]|uniref:hypothetical protein n=1 Tax=Caldalkalibacillus salinus TaxID=2803787 RepID=UPI0019203C75|nr:hypothetical protein [Caldalkalibacillus salinus]